MKKKLYLYPWLAEYLPEDREVTQYSIRSESELRSLLDHYPTETQEIRLLDQAGHIITRQRKWSRLEKIFLRPPTEEKLLEGIVPAGRPVRRVVHCLEHKADHIRYVLVTDTTTAKVYVVPKGILLRVWLQEPEPVTVPVRMNTLIPSPATTQAK